MTTTLQRRAPVHAVSAGLGLTVVAAIVPYLDHAAVLADHIRAGYPTYPQTDVDAAVSTYLVYLTVVGVLGLIGWLATLWAVRAGKRWARWVATSLFLVGTGIALFDLLVRDTSGDSGLPPLLGWVGMLPSLAGLVVVVLLWRRS